MFLITILLSLMILPAAVVLFFFMQGQAGWFPLFTNTILCLLQYRKER